MATGDEATENMTAGNIGVRYKASANGVRISPRKVRLVVDMIRGKNVQLALGLLDNVNKRACPVVKTLLKSAIANAEQQGGNDVDVDGLTVKTAFVNSGRTLKRFRPRAMGRATPIRKRSSKITLIVG
jgi:large subunit ribosomal protein L22